jgi:KEOPS complex subunit Pcc1
MKRTVTITLAFPSKELSETVLKAIQPETGKPTTSRSQVHIFEDQHNVLTMRVEARDTSAMRATLNSYLRWVALVTDTYEAATRLEEAKTE